MAQIYDDPEDVLDTLMLVVEGTRGVLVCATQEEASRRAAGMLCRDGILALGVGANAGSFVADVVVVACRLDDERAREWARSGPRARLRPGGLWVEVT